MPGLSSIAWSQGRVGGNSCNASSKKTLEYVRYCDRMLGFSDVCLGLATILQMYILLVCIALALLTYRGRNRARAASELRSMMGSWLWSIQPIFQSICG
jgi:hypothetical protein